MKRKMLVTLGLLVVMAVTACAPSAEPPPPTEAVDSAPTEEPLPVATSRGNDLAATDPGTVNLATGEPQLIEFFAFW